MSFNFIDNLHQGTGHTTDHDCGSSYASFHPVSAIPTRNGTQQQARSLLNFSSVPDSASNLPGLSSVYFPFRHHQLQSNTAPSFNPSQPIATPSHNPLQLNTTPSYNPLQSSSAIPYNPLQPSTAPLPHSLQQSATVQLTNTPSILGVGVPSPGAGLDSAPILLDISNILLQSSTAISNQCQIEIQAEHQLISKNALAYRCPVQGTSPNFGTFSPSMLSSSHFPSQTDTATHHYVIADQAGHQLISTRAVTVISPTQGASFDSAGPSTQLHNPPQPNTADQDHYGSSRQAAHLLNTSSPSTILNPNSGTGPAASVEKLTRVSTQYPSISTDPPLARPYTEAATGNHDIADCPGRSDQNIDIKLTLCPKDKPCVYGSPLCESCYVMLSIISEDPSQARQFTRSSVNAREPLTAALDRHPPPGDGMNVHGGPNYPAPTLAHTNPHPHPLQHQPLPEQPRTKPSYQPSLLAPEKAQSERECVCQQQVQQLKARVLSLEQKFQQLQSCLMYWEQPPSIHKQKRSPPKTRPTSQWHKSSGYVSPMNHDDTSRELPCHIEEVLKSEHDEVSLHQSIRQRRQSTSLPLTSGLSSLTPHEAPFSKNQLRLVTTSPTDQKAPQTMCNDSGGRRISQERTGENAKARGDRKKLDEELVREIKRCREENPDMSYDEIARKYGVGKTTAWRIFNPDSK
ncbi:MAG: hypothetical protein J3Q66DRAFT_444030 [Benniella sp.]|nr:MAG: hypothetical protein J3Q66DRAFT_444030 [Benniella sp.]